MDNHFLSTINQFKNLKVLVLGDAMLDRYLSGNSNRLCREAPVPIVDIGKEKEFPGGAANTAVNVAQMGAQVTLVSVVGEDREGESLIRELKKFGVNTETVLQEKGRRTLTKQRVSAGEHLLVRFDYGSTEDISSDTENRIIGALTEFFAQADGIIVSDYGYGLLSEKVIVSLSRLQKKSAKVLMVDSKYLDKYSWVNPTVVKPNFQEATALLGVNPESGSQRLKQISGLGPQLLKFTGAAVAAVTVDTEGSIVFQKGKAPYRTYTVPVENSRAAGSGDTYTSVFTLSLAAGTDISEAAELAAAAASIVVQKEGTAVCSAKELQFSFSVYHKYVQDERQLELLMDQYKASGKKIVFTNGCFDILHSGHVQYLSSAKSFGDVLVVALNSDDSVKKLKGPSRPINTLAERVKVLSALSSIDHLVSFAEDVPFNLIKKIKPDVYVKGGDYTRETLPEAPVVEALGGVVRIVPYINGRSTTNIINQIQKQTNID